MRRAVVIFGAGVLVLGAGGCGTNSAVESDQLQTRAAPGGSDGAEITGESYGVDATEGDWRPDGPSTSVREVHRFESLAELVASADAVAIIRINDVITRTFFDPDGGTITTYDVQATVEEVLAGSLAVGDLDLALDSAFWDPAFRGTDSDWMAKEARVLVALHERIDNGSYLPLNTQSLFRIDSSEMLTAVWSSPLSDSFDGVALSEMRRNVAEAVELVRAGSVAPQEGRPLSSP